MGFGEISPQTRTKKQKHIIAWIKYFLSDKIQRVKINNVFSEWSDIWGNVHKGTLLRILLFLIVINNLKICCPSVKLVDFTVYKLGNLDEISDTSLRLAEMKLVHGLITNYMKI